MTNKPQPSLLLLLLLPLLLILCSLLAVSGRSQLAKAPATFQNTDYQPDLGYICHWLLWLMRSINRFWNKSHWISLMIILACTLTWHFQLAPCIWIHCNLLKNVKKNYCCSWHQSKVILLVVRKCTILVCGDSVISLNLFHGSIFPVIFVYKPISSDLFPFGMECLPHTTSVWLSTGSSHQRY